MKRIINGLTYNTETATKVAYSKVRDLRVNDVRDLTLYVTRGGAFFVHERDHAEDSDEFMPQTREEAQKWILEGEVDIFNDVLAEPPEAEAEASPEATIILRVPRPLKDRIDQEAKAMGQSLNAWGIRCLEGCVGAVAREQEQLERWMEEMPKE